jgi:hypothetical protein
MAQNLFMLEVNGADTLEHIAIVGMACRFPALYPLPRATGNSLATPEKETMRSPRIDSTPMHGPIRVTRRKVPYVSKSLSWSNYYGILQA